MRAYLYLLATDQKQGPVAGVLKFFLYLLSLAYGLIVRLLIVYCRLFPKPLGCKVISVGNITVGGTGKTVLVEYVAGFLQQQGHKAAIISRGYKRKNSALGDEPYMLSQKLPGIPLIVDANRQRAALRAVREHGVDTVILDDALQQWRLIKDLEIVTIDATNPFGNRCLLPRGLLRQPLSSLKAADIFVLTKVNLAAELKSTKETLSKLNPGAGIVESVHQPIGFYAYGNPDNLLPMESLAGKRAIIFCGIGDPQSFAALIRGLGVTIEQFFQFPDHHHYSASDLRKITRAGQAEFAGIIITTEKDASRIKAETPDAAGVEKILILRIRLQITQDGQ